MLRNAKIFTLILTLFGSVVFAANPVEKNQLPAHKQATIEPVGHDVIPGYKENRPINDVIRTVTQKESPQNAKVPINRVQRNTNYGEHRKDYTRVELERLLQRLNTNKRSLSEEELSAVEEYVQDLERQKADTFKKNNNTIGANNNNEINGNNRTQILSDDFSYANGSLVGNGSWVTYSGSTPGQVQVSGGLVLLTDSDSEDVRAEFAPISTGTLYFGIDVQITDPTTYTGTDFEYFIGFSDTSGYSLYARTDAAAFSATGWSPGIANGSSTAEATWATELSYATTYRIVVGINISTGISDLWVDPTSSSDTKISGTGTVTITELSGLFLRQSSASPDLNISVDNLVVSDTFSDVITTSSTTTNMSEGFEGATFPPSGWLAISNNTSNSVTQSSSQAHGGTYSARLSSYSYASDYTQYLITPKLTAASGDSIIFWYRKYSSGSETFSVGISTTDSDVASFTFGSDVTNASTTWQRYAEDLSSYAGQNIYVAIKYSSIYEYYLYIDDVSGPEVWVDPSPVATLSASSLDFGLVNTSSSKSKTVVLTNSGGADLTGTIASDATEFTVGIATIALAAGASDTITVTYTPSAEGAQSGNVIFTHNGASSPDTVTVTGTGTTSLLVEGFENDAWTGSPAAPPDWSQITVSGTNVWERKSSSYYAHTGSYSAKGPWASAGGEHLLITPGLDLGDGTDNYKLVFWVDGSSYSGTDLYVQIGTSNATAAGFTDTLASYIAGSTMPSSYAQQGINLTGYTGTQYIAFRMVDADGYSVYIDDIEVELIPPEPTLSLSYSAVSFFPNTIGGTLVADVFTVGTNSGAGALVIDSIKTTNSDYTASLTTMVTGDTVIAGGNVDLDLSWTPTTFGMTSSDVIIYHNAASSPDTFKLMGEAGYQYTNFDDQTFPSGWTIVDNDSINGYGYDDGWIFNSYYGPGYGGYYARSHFNVDGANDWMIPSKLSVVSGDSVIFYNNSSSSSILEDTLHVYVSTTDNQLASFTTEIGEILSQGYTNLRSGFDLSTYAGQDIYVAIVHHGSAGSNYWSYRKVDDVLLPAKWINPNAEVLLSTTALDFGGTFAGYTRTETLIITNNGSPDLTITDITSDNVAVSVSPTTATLAYDSSATFTVTLTATAVNDTGSATLSIVSNDATNPTLSVDWVTGEYDLSEFTMSTGLSDFITAGSYPDYISDDANDTITIVDNSGLMESAMIFVDLVHTYMSDLDFTLTSPSGDQVVFFEGVGGSGDNMFTVVLDGGSNTSPPFFPDAPSSNSLNDFVSGMSANGDWSLNIHDNWGGDDGTLFAWGIKYLEGASGIVAGSVTDSETGLAIDSATVTIGTITTMSGSDGSYLLETLVSDEAVISFEKNGYLNATFTIAISDVDTLSLSAALVPENLLAETVYETGFESGDDMGWTYTGGTNPFEVSGGFTFDTLTVAPATGDSMIVCSPAGYADNEFSWWMNLTDSNMDLSTYAAAEVTLKMNYWTEAGYDNIILLANRPDIDGGTYYYVDINGDGVGNSSDVLSGSSDGWVEVTADLTPYSGQPYGVEIAILFMADGLTVDGFGVAVDDISVTGFIDPRPSVNDLMAESFVDDQIALTWSDPTGGGRTVAFNTIAMDRVAIESVDARNPRKSYQYEMGKMDIELNQVSSSDRDLVSYNIFRAGTDVSFSLIGNTNGLSFTDVGVENYTYYIYYVTAVYDEGESMASNWAAAGAGSVVDLTMADLAVDFEDSTSGNWVVDTTLGENGWEIGDSASAASSYSQIPDNGGKFAYVNDDAVGSGVSSKSTFDSHFFSIDDAEAATLSFDYFNESSSQDLNVWYAVGWDTYGLLGQLPPMGDVWSRVSVDISFLQGVEHVRIYFAYDDGGSWAYSAAIDNIVVETIPGPTNLTATPSPEDVTLSWDALSRTASRINEYPNGVSQAEKELAHDLLSGISEHNELGIVDGNRPGRSFSRAQGDSIGNPFVIDALPFYVEGSTNGFTHNYNEECPYSSSGALDVVYELTLANDIPGLVINLCESYYDTKVYVYANGDTNDVVGCNDDYCTASHGQEWTSYLETEPLAAGTYHIIVDGYSASDSGTYVMSVMEMEPLPDVMYSVFKEGILVASDLETNEYVDNMATLNEACYVVTASLKTLGTDGNEESFVQTGASNTACAGIVNQPPGEFSLLTPSDGDTIMITPENVGANQLFAWNASVDPNGTPVEYEICWSITSPFYQECDLNGTSTANFFPMQDIVDLIDSLYQAGGSSLVYTMSWTVYASDGVDETEAMNGPRSVTFDAGYALGVGDETGIPDVFALHQNFPNPFNPVTNIRFDVPKDGLVQIAIYNVLGQKVHTLVNQSMKAGYHSAIWNGTNDQGKPLASGMYIYQIQAKGFTAVKKLVLMK